ncbi:MAG TPA: winged helix-turn-helix domain-containing protein [Thermotogota bacterium]|nr:winged helix-turn-helix domain-containing protein [Thermotogota bacterium]
MGKKILYSDTFDYWASLMGCFCVRKDKENEIEYENQTDSEISEYYEELWEKILNSPEMLFVKNDLKMMTESERFFFLVMELLRENSVNELIEMDVATFYTKSLEINFEGEKTGDKDEIFTALKMELDDNYNTTDCDYIMMKELVYNTRVLKERLNDVLRKTYDYFLEEIYTDEKKGAIQKELNKFQGLLNEDEGEFLKSITLLNTPEKDFIPEELDIYMTYFAPYSYTFMMKRLTLMFGIGMPDQIKKRNEKLNIETFLKILADPTRYKMIKLLSNKAYYGAELAKELGLSTATISHHMEKIYNLKLTNAISGENNKLYIQLNKVDLESYLEELKADLLS